MRTIFMLFLHDGFACPCKAAYAGAGPGKRKAYAVRGVGGGGGAIDAIATRSYKHMRYTSGIRVGLLSESKVSFQCKDHILKPNFCFDVN